MYIIIPFWVGVNICFGLAGIQTLGYNMSKHSDKFGLNTRLAKDEKII